MVTPVCRRCETQLDAAVHGLCPRCLLDVALGDPDSGLDAGEDEGRFRIITLLGRGTHGTTYLAEQDEQPRFVSLKVLDDAGVGTTRRSVDRVRNILMSARHPSLVQLVSMDFDRKPTIAAAYVQGRKIAAVSGDLKTGASDLVSAIGYLHERGVVHGNIHAANVLAAQRDGETRWCLIDLAAARPLTSAADVAQDLASFGRVMRDLAPALENIQVRDKLSEIAGRAAIGGYATASDLARELAIL